MNRVPKKIGLLHHMGGGNLGDDGTLDAVLQSIRNRWANAEVIGLSMNPDDTLKRHGIVSYPIRQRTWGLGSVFVNNRATFKEHAKAVLRGYPLLFQFLKAIRFLILGIPSAILNEILFLARAIRVMRSLDLLIVCGGGQLVESSGGPWEFVGGPWQFPFTIFKWILGARLFHARCLVLNVGAGPLVKFISKCFVVGSLLCSDYVSFRDEDSEALIRRLGFKGRTYVVCDTAYCLDIPPARRGPLDKSAAPKTYKATVGLAPMAYGDPRLSPKHDPQVYNDFIQRLASFATWLLKNGYRVTLFCTDIGIDPPAIEDLEKLLRSNSDVSNASVNGSLLRVHQWTTQELLANMSSMDYVVVCRFHAVVFAHLLNLPVLAVNHHPKVRSQMNDLGLSEYCVDIENCETAVLARTFLSLVENRAGIKRRMSQKLTMYRGRLNLQFDNLFPRQNLQSLSSPAKVRTRPSQMSTREQISPAQWHSPISLGYMRIYLALSRRLWILLPGVKRRCLVGRAYGRHLHALVCNYSQRRQNHSTFFLRNRPELKIMCHLLEQKPPGANLNITVLACSKGAEVYSILWAIRSARPDLQINLQAIDISQEIIDFAGRGVYCIKRPNSFKEVHDRVDNGTAAVAWNTYRDQGPGENVSILERMTDQEIDAMLELEGDVAKVRAWLKEGITWSVGDANDPGLAPALGPQDIVVANRFLCHMGSTAAEKCLRNIGKLVKPGGYLFVSGVDVDVRTKVAEDLQWEPVPELMKEMHEGDSSLTNGWPFEWWGLEPFCHDQENWKIRFAAVFWVNNRNNGVNNERALECKNIK